MWGSGRDELRPLGRAALAAVLKSRLIYYYVLLLLFGYLYPSNIMLREIPRSQSDTVARAASPGIETLSPLSVITSIENCDARISLGRCFPFLLGSLFPANLPSTIHLDERVPDQSPLFLAPSSRSHFPFPPSNRPLFRPFFSPYRTCIPKRLTTRPNSNCFSIFCNFSVSRLSIQISCGNFPYRERYTGKINNSAKLIMSYV